MSILSPDILYSRLCLTDPLSKWYKVLLSNCFGRPVNSTKDVEKWSSDAELTKALLVPYTVFGSVPKDLVFATDARSIPFLFKFGPSVYRSSFVSILQHIRL